MSKEVMQIAYDALTTVHRGDFEADCEFNYEKCWKAIKALKVELDKPEPEPVAWMHPIHTSLIEPHKFDPDCIPLYRKEDL